MRWRAMIDPQSINVEERTVDVIFATEAPVRMYSWEDGRVEEVLSFDDGHVRWDRINSGAPVLDNHQRYGSIEDTQIGVVLRAWKDGSAGRATLQFDDEGKSDRIWKKIIKKQFRNISVGYNVYSYRKTERDGQLPEYRAIDWEPMEISMVPVPADYNAGVRSEESEPRHDVSIIHSHKATKMNIEQMRAEVTRLRGIASPTEAEVTQLRDLESRLAEAERGAAGPVPAPAPAPNPAPAPAPAPANSEAATRTERQRASDIMAAVRTARLDQAFAEKLIADGVSVDQARAAIIEAWAKNEDPNKPQSGNRSASVGADESDKRRAVIEDALVLRSGHVEAKDFKPEQVNAAREFRTMSLLDLAKDSLERAGISTKGLDKMEIAARAITSSSSDFPVLLEGTNRRVLLAAYQTVPDTWRQFCAVGSVGDFRDYKRVRMTGSFNNLDKVPENAEYKNKSIADGEFESVRVETFGNTINVSRKMIINDDLNAFTRLAAMLGRAAARSIELDVYKMLALNSGLGPVMNDGKTLFHADHGNILSTPTPAAPSVAQFEAMRLLMAKQKDLGVDDFLDLRPSIWLGPIELGGQARVVNDAQYDVDVSNKFQVPNRVRGLFRNIIDTPRLSGAAYYAFVDPNEEPVLEVNFLDGVQTPYMEQEQAFSVDGIRWKIRLDYGVDAIGWRGAVRNPGTNS